MRKHLHKAHLFIIDYSGIIAAMILVATVFFVLGVLLNVVTKPPFQYPDVETTRAPVPFPSVAQSPLPPPETPIDKPSEPIEPKPTLSTELPPITILPVPPREPPQRAPTPKARADHAEHKLKCLTPGARGLLARIEAEFGEVHILCTCDHSYYVAGTRRVSRHVSGNAIDFTAGDKKPAMLAWLIANHRQGGVMTYSHSQHIHVDIGPRFVALAHRDLPVHVTRVGAQMEPTRVAARVVHHRRHHRDDDDDDWD